MQDPEGYMSFTMGFSTALWQPSPAHGFPERPQEYDELDDELRERIEDRTRRLGQLKDLKKWLRQNRKPL
jgi:hypothetical protein